MPKGQVRKKVVGGRKEIGDIKVIRYFLLRPVPGDTISECSLDVVHKRCRLLGAPTASDKYVLPSHPLIPGFTRLRGRDMELSLVKVRSKAEVRTTTAAKRTINNSI